MASPAATEPRKDPGVFRLPGFASFWAAGSISVFGTYVSVIALQVLIVETLHGTATDVGLVNGARWVPYLLLGLVAGALVDRRRRKPLLVGTDLGRGILLALVPVLWLLGWLNVPVLMVFVAILGVLSLVNDAASQSFLPRLVPRQSLVAAHARLDQVSAVAQTSGPALGGALVSLIGAPLAVLADAVSYVVSAIVIARIRVQETLPKTADVSERLRTQIADGLRWIYRHHTLAPFAISVHLWFVFNSMLGTVYVPFVLLGQQLSAWELGITLSASGVGAIVGSLAATGLGARLGTGPAVIACYALMPVGWVVIALSPAFETGGERAATIAILAIGQFVWGVALGASNPNEMGYRQAVTPDALQARTNTTMRSFNRAAIIVGAPLGGVLADSIGYRPTIWIALGGLVLVTIILAASPFRHARQSDGL